MWWYWDRSREPLVSQRPAPYRTIRRCNLDVVVPGPNQKRTMAFALRSTAHSGWKVQPRLCRFARCSDSIAPTPCTIATAWRARPTTACRLRTESVGSRTDIENWRPETRAGNWSDVTKNSENYASEIPHRLANSRECRAYFCEPDIACRDGTGWLG